MPTIFVHFNLDAVAQADSNLPIKYSDEQKIAKHSGCLARFRMCKIMDWIHAKVMHIFLSLLYIGR